MSAPRRRHVLTIEIGADSPRHIADLLEELAEEIDRDQLTERGTRAGMSVGHTWAYTTDPTVTHDSYERDLAVWRARRQSEPEPLDAAGALLLLVATFTDRMPSGDHVRSTWWKREDFEAIEKVSREDPMSDRRADGA